MLHVVLWLTRWSRPAHDADNMHDVSEDRHVEGKTKRRSAEWIECYVRQKRQPLPLASTVT